MSLYLLRLRLPGASPVAQVLKNPSAMPEIWVPALGQEDPLEKGTATCSNILAWRISWTEDPGRLHSPGGCKESDVTEPRTHDTSSTAESTCYSSSPALSS